MLSHTTFQACFMTFFCFIHTCIKEHWNVDTRMRSNSSIKHLQWFLSTMKEFGTLLKYQKKFAKMVCHIFMSLLETIVLKTIKNVFEKFICKRYNQRDWKFWNTISKTLKCILISTLFYSINICRSKSQILDNLINLSFTMA